TYAFIDSLVQRQERYLAGDRAVLASNWAQTYANVADSVRREWTSDSARGARAADSVRLTAMGRSGAGSPLADSVARMKVAYDRKLLEVSALLDTAISYDDRYIPVMLSYSALR